MSGLKPKSVWHQSSNASHHVPVASLLHIRFLVPASATIFPQETCKGPRMHVLIKCCSNKQLFLGVTHQQGPPAQDTADESSQDRCAGCTGSDLVDPAPSSRPRDLEQWLLRPTGRCLQARQPGQGQVSQAYCCSPSRYTIGGRGLRANEQMPTGSSHHPAAGPNEKPTCPESGAGFSS